MRVGAGRVILARRAVWGRGIARGRCGPFSAGGDNRLRCSRGAAAKAQAVKANARGPGEEKGLMRGGSDAAGAIKRGCRPLK